MKLNKTQNCQTNPRIIPQVGFVLDNQSFLGFPKVLFCCANKRSMPQNVAAPFLTSAMHETDLFFDIAKDVDVVIT